MKNLKFLLILLLLLVFAVPSFAADSTITGLTDLSAVPDSDDEFVMWDNSTALTKKVSYSNLADIRVDIAKNLLINGGMTHAQRGASGSASFTSATNTANDDDTVLIDRMLNLSDGNDVVDVSQQSGGGVSGNEMYARLDIETAQKKFALCQIIENKNTKSIVGSTASVSAEIKVTNATRLSDIRMVVLSWSSTADSVTSDLVSAWAAESTVFTPAANWTAENVAVNLSVTTSWVKYKIENISIDTASTTNVATCIYQNNVATASSVGDFLEITNFQLEPGAVSTDFEYLGAGQSLSLSQRYYQKSYDQDVVPGTATEVGRHSLSLTAVANADYTVKISPHFPTPMRDNPTIVVYDDVGASGKASMAGSDAKTATITNIGHSGFTCAATRGAATTTRDLQFQHTAASEL